MARKTPVWTFADITERDAFGTAQGVVSGDFALVQATGGLFRWNGSSWVAVGGGGRTQSFSTFTNWWASNTTERMPSWYTFNSVSTISVFAGGAPAQTIVQAPFNCHARVQLRSATGTGSGWGLTTVRLYSERDDSVAVASDTFDFTSGDLRGTFDLSGHDIDEGDFVGISIETTSGDAVMMIQLNLDER